MCRIKANCSFMLDISIYSPENYKKTLLETDKLLLKS